MTVSGPWLGSLRIIDMCDGRGDRSQFMRDAEAARRLGDPRASRLYLRMLCRRRAWVEIYDLFATRSITQVELQDAHRSREAELISFCVSMGYFTTEVTHLRVGTRPR